MFKHLRECVRACVHAHVHAPKSDKKSEGGSESKCEGEHEMARAKQNENDFVYAYASTYACVLWKGEGGGAKTNERGHFSCEEQIDNRPQSARMHTWP